MNKNKNYGGRKMVTIKGLKEMKKDTTNEFKTWVIGDILSQGKKQDVLDYIKNAQYGCASGAVTSLIYYSDTKKIFSKYFEDILEIITDYSNETGYNLENDNLNYNGLTWMAYDIIISEIYNTLED